MRKFAVALALTISLIAVPTAQAGLSPKVARLVMNHAITNFAHQQSWYSDSRSMNCETLSASRARCYFWMNYWTYDDATDRDFCGIGYVYYTPGYTYGWRWFATSCF